MSIKIFYHIFVNSEERSINIVKDQINTIKNSNLINICESINCCITGNDYNNYNLIIKTIENESGPFKIIKKEFNDRTYERFTLNEIIKYISPEDKILYFHSKGSSRNDSIECINNWRKMMEYFLIENAEKCIQYLENHELVGCMFHYHPSRHFSGNFWWAKGEYFIQNYNLYSDFLNSYSDYINPELFIGKSANNVKEIYEYNSCGYGFSIPRSVYCNQIK
jgi:hypothetical protein